MSVSIATKEEIDRPLKIPKEKIEVIYEAADSQIGNPKSEIAKMKFNTANIFYMSAMPIRIKIWKDLIQAFNKIAKENQGFKINFSREQRLFLSKIGKEKINRIR